MFGLFNNLWLTSTIISVVVIVQEYISEHFGFFI